MKRYRVLSKASPSEDAAYFQWLSMHAAEVVLAGGFTGAELVETGGILFSEYGTTPSSLETYLAKEAPALRAEAEKLFPSIPRSREVMPLHVRVSAPFPWASLGLRTLDGAEVACPADGPFTLHYVAPWCGDCVGSIDSIARAVKAAGDRAALVCVYASPEDASAFVSDRAPDVTTYTEPTGRTEFDRVRSFHSVLRHLSGDARRWGLPMIQPTFVRQGRFVARWA